MVCARRHGRILIARYVWTPESSSWVLDETPALTRLDDSPDGMRGWIGDPHEAGRYTKPDGTDLVRLHCKRCRADITIDWTNLCERLTRERLAGRYVVDLPDLIRTLTT